MSLTRDDLRTALIQANPQLSRYNPLPRIFFYDDFDQGINGWVELTGNHNGDLTRIREITRDLRPPQLSNCTFFDVGTHGSVNGVYSMKLATRPRAGHMSQAIKRMTFVKQGLVQLETYFTFKAEQSFNWSETEKEAWDGNQDPSETYFGEFTFSNDNCEDHNGARYHCALRYVNADEHGNLVQKWMYKTSLQTSTKMQMSGMVSPPEDYHVQDPNDWEEIPGGYQPLCFNEIATKINWHYLRWVWDTRTRRNVELQVNNNVMDLRDIPVPVYDHPYSGLSHLLNFCIDVRTRRNVRNFLFLDSILVSVDW